MPELTQAEFKYLVQRQREEIKTITDVGRLLSSAADPQELIRLVASYLKQAFPIALCGMLLTEQRTLRLIQFAKASQMDLENAARAIRETANQRLAKPLKTEELRHMFDDQSGIAGQGAHAPFSYLRSSHSASLLFDGQTIGLLSVFSGKPDAFTSDDRHVIDIVADQLGAGLRNTFLLDELKRAGELKNQLLNVISHELRIPLATIKEGLSLLGDSSLGPTTADQRDFLHTVTDNAERLERLVEKVVLTTQIVTGQLAYTLQEMDLGVALAELVEQARPLAEAKQVRLERSQAASAMTAPGDAKRLKQALANLIENAIHATAEGGRVRVTCSATAADVAVEIADTGSGIPAEELPAIFDPFRLIGGIDNRKTGGLGLGLFIAKAIVEGHRGTIHLESELGRGTRVAIHLPAQRK